MSDITKKLAAVQQSLKVPKGKQNKFGNYAYRSCEDILEAVKPHLGKHGLTLVIEDSIHLVGERYYVEASATLKYEGQAVDAVAYARESLTKKGMDDAQVTGSASSYARKYALCGLFLIDGGGDPDEAEPQDHNSPIDKQQQSTIEKMIALLPEETQEAARQWIGCSISQIELGTYERVINGLQAKLSQVGG